MMCKHIYQDIEAPKCSSCGSDTHEVDWAFQNELHKDWIASGKAVVQGWWSI